MKFYGLKKIKREGVGTCFTVYIKYNNFNFIDTISNENIEKPLINKKTKINIKNKTNIINIK